MIFQWRSRQLRETGKKSHHKAELWHRWASWSFRFWNQFCEFLSKSAQSDSSPALRVVGGIIEYWREWPAILICAMMPHRKPVQDTHLHTLLKDDPGKCSYIRNCYRAIPKRMILRLMAQPLHRHSGIPVYDDKEPMGVYPEDTSNILACWCVRTRLHPQTLTWHCCNAFLWKGCW